MIPNIFSVERRSIVWTTLYAVLHHGTWMRFIPFWIAKHPAFRFRVHSIRVTSDHFRLGLRSRSVSRHLLEALDEMASPLPHLPGIPLFLNSLILLRSTVSCQQFFPKLSCCALIIRVLAVLGFSTYYCCRRTRTNYSSSSFIVTHQIIPSSSLRVLHPCSALIIIRQGLVYATKKMRRYYAV